jgi:hypothetical protein
MQTYHASQKQPSEFSRMTRTPFCDYIIRLKVAPFSERQQ